MLLGCLKSEVSIRRELNVLFFPVRLKSIKTQEARMQTILVKIKGMLRDKQEEVEDKLHRDQFIALLQGATGFALSLIHI